MIAIAAQVQNMFSDAVFAASEPSGAKLVGLQRTS